MQRLRYAISLGLAAMVSGVAAAQSDIDPAHKFAWAERAGWLNWQTDRPNPGDGVRIELTYLSGYVWGENVGWINVGDGTPTNGVSYANLNNSDFGVNLNGSTGALTGMAWGENIGWINFNGGALAVPPNPARIDFDFCRFRGYAWGENIGWINLDDASDYLALTASACGTATCPGDINGDLSVDLADLAILLSNYGATHATYEMGDLNGDNFVDLTDLAALLANYGMTC